MAASDITMPNGKFLADIIANLNSFATLPTTSRGGGEIIHYSGDNTIRWNSQTANPTTNPIWSELGASTNIPGTNSVSFIIDQDNAGVGVSSSLRFNRGSTDGDAAIWWDETDDEFQFESDVGVTIGSILIDECRHGGSVKTSRNPSTGDYEIEVASGDSIVFKAV